MDKLTTLTPPAPGYIPQRPLSVTPEDEAPQPHDPSSDHTKAAAVSYRPQEPIRMHQPSGDGSPDLRGGRRDHGCCECCLYCCGIVVLIKCLDSFCG
ncbi:hypothetical protein M406DRAFT_323257 [Cryphonectria parasitica EP155]|uniref:Uncharacterized protein n=1 Tax=Cryphonectria parasitica (strain ATCC 38755 / EP155) TaxID=660469 RepID=A0A9P4XZE6_CRYP1|nr:uncharacterized protein M406DRAFT_323257 [Cryphonectria parasitica EP155]KAF3763688.1 hypothetical protein M406DRAFT_323257 [Cryphonectria parasitica EP155]